MAYLNSINTNSTDYAINSFANLLLASGGVTDAKTVTFPNGYDVTDGSNMTFRVLFPYGHNGQANMTLNGVDVVVNKYGTLIPLPYHNISSTYKSLQANTVLEMYYTSNYDGNNTPAFVIVGNPIVLSSDNYIIYADGQMGGCPPINATYVQFPQQASPNELWGNISTWTELNYSGAFFRASGGNAAAFNGGKQWQSIQSHNHNFSWSGKHSHSINDPGHNHQVELGIDDGGAGHGGERTERHYGLDYTIKSTTGISVDSATISISGTTGSAGTTETRPDNYTIRVWKRTA